MVSTSFPVANTCCWPAPSPNPCARDVAQNSGRIDFHAARCLTQDLPYAKSGLPIKSVGLAIFTAWISPFILCKACSATTANSAMLVEMTKSSAHRFFTGEAQGCCAVRKPQFDQDLIMHPSVFGQLSAMKILESLFPGRASLARASFRNGVIESIAEAFCRPTSPPQQRILCACTTFAGRASRRMAIDDRMDAENELNDFSWGEPSPLKNS